MDEFAEIESQLIALKAKFTDDMRNAILQAAMQGKLTEQRPEEDTGEELYQQIQKEKIQLIKGGKIKKEKPLPEIRADEVPFDIPTNWKWVRLGKVISLLSGQDMQASCYNSFGKGIPYVTGASNIESGTIFINRWTEVPKAIAVKDDILLTCKGTVGKMAVLNEPKVHIARQIMAISVIGVDAKYVQYFIQSKIDLLKSQAKSMIPGIERASVMNLPLPLPPIEEQKRIVEKLDKLLGLVRGLKNGWR